MVNYSCFLGARAPCVQGAAGKKGHQLGPECPTWGLLHTFFPNCGNKLTNAANLAREGCGGQGLRYSGKPLAPKEMRAEGEENLQWIMRKEPTNTSCDSCEVAVAGAVVRPINSVLLGFCQESRRS